MGAAESCHKEECLRASAAELDQHSGETLMAPTSRDEMVHLMETPGRLLDIQSASDEQLADVFRANGLKNKARHRASTIVAARPIAHATDLPLLPGLTDRSIYALAMGIDPRSLPGIGLVLPRAARRNAWPSGLCDRVEIDERDAITGQVASPEN